MVAGRRDRRKEPGTWPVAPRLGDARGLTERDAEAMRTEAAIERGALRRLQVPGIVARDLVIRESEVASLGAAAATLDRSVFEDSRLSACDLVGGTLERSRWTRLVLDGCRLSGANLDGSVLHDVAFVDCQLEHLRLQGARLEGVSFVRCSLRGAYLMESTLARVRMIDCDLREMDVRHAALTSVDLRQSRLEEIGLAVDQFAGLTVTTEQALDLAIRIGGLSVDDRVVLADGR
jgi:uncharacterized protein YjbI with pentapeptide repeats